MSNVDVSKTKLGFSDLSSYHAFFFNQNPCIYLAFDYGYFVGLLWRFLNHPDNADNVTISDNAEKTAISFGLATAAVLFDRNRVI